MRTSTRRRFLIAFGAVGLCGAFPALAQQQKKLWRVGYLSLLSGPDESIEAMREEFRSLAYLEGRNLQIEFRWAAGREERVPQLAAELVRLKMDAIVTRSTFVAAATKRATATIPIVMANAADPVGSGVIASLSRPGGNVTGVSQNSTEIAGKRLQLLREIVPKAARVAALVWTNSPLRALFLEQIRTATRQLGITLLIHEAGTVDALAGAFGAMQRENAQGVIVQNTPFTGLNRKRIAELAVQHRLPAMFEGRASVADGGLMSYGASVIEMHRHAAQYVDKILKGAKPADLPVEQPTKFEMIINVGTAKALGLTIPRQLQLQATELIQ